ncbi:MAG: stimulus-sensing domain-containing protein [Alphaproteobacteria bacterium]|nr:stimulus-sensing domain-containing protein [Alphaproteobacteria bacterium]MCB9975341.1 stimulus-sensing domain-containing protein [Rhodospirillales bacterium]
MTKSKPSTESDTRSKSSHDRWLRIGLRQSEFDQLFDLYWGGTQGRITGLTLRIIAVNAIALLSLMLGVLYLGDYQSRLIQSKLETFETEIFLITAAVTEASRVDPEFGGHALIREDVRRIVGLFGATLGKRIRVFDREGQLIADSKSLIEDLKIEPMFVVQREEGDNWESIKMLKRMGAFFITFLPEQNALPQYFEHNSIKAEDYTNVVEALNSRSSFSAWRDRENGIMLTAAMPIKKNSEVLGVTYLVSEGRDIRKALGDAWFDILRVFFATLLFTVILSIYLSGVIARPLRRLADAADKVRRGKLRGDEIPDMSNRKDEIGELSVALSDMTRALLEKMDAMESFAADVSHEIKNPLTSLKSAIESVRVVKKKEDQEKLLAIILHDIARLDRLISDISSASRIEAELSRESFEILSVRTLLRRLIDLYKNPLDRSKNRADPDTAIKDGVMIMLDYPYEEDILILGNDGRLGQVFHNIISNALTFTPVKSIIKIKVQKKQKRVVISFEDEGPGIPENNLKTVFDRFYSERPQEQYGRHSGLGLSICRQIIEAHNGMIYAENVKSRQGKTTGARFVIVLNIAEGGS